MCEIVLQPMHCAGGDGGVGYGQNKQIVMQVNFFFYNFIGFILFVFLASPGLIKMIKDSNTIYYKYKTTTKCSMPWSKPYAPRLNRPGEQHLASAKYRTDSNVGHFGLSFKLRNLLVSQNLKVAKLLMSKQLYTPSTEPQQDQSKC